MKTFSAKKRKLNYTIHNPNTVEETAKILLDVLVQANEKKVERKWKESCKNWQIMMRLSIKKPKNDR